MARLVGVGVRKYGSQWWERKKREMGGLPEVDESEAGYKARWEEARQWVMEKVDQFPQAVQIEFNSAVLARYAALNQCRNRDRHAARHLEETALWYEARGHALLEGI